MPDPNRKRRVPLLRFTELRGIGWHVSYRDRDSGTPRKHRFGMVSKAEAERAYHAWVAAYLGDDAEAMTSLSTKRPKTISLDGSTSTKVLQRHPSPKAARAQAEPGSLLHVASSLIRFEEARTRDGADGRVAGTISPLVSLNRKKDIEDFLAFLNEQHGKGAVARMRLADLMMADVEGLQRPPCPDALLRQHAQPQNAGRETNR